MSAATNVASKPNGADAGSSSGLMSTRMDIIDTAGGKILCVSDIRGKLSHLNTLAVEHGAKAIIHAGDFGFYNVNSLDRINDRTLRHLIQYSNLISATFRTQMIGTKDFPYSEMRRLLRESNSTPDGFALSEFNKLLTGELKLTVPVYTVWGACEDVEILERLRSAPPGPTRIAASNQPSHTSGPAHADNWSIPNLTVLSEGTTRVLNIGGIRLRLFGLGGAVVGHKLFDNGEGSATIAGGGGTMWTTILQIGELVDTAQRVFDPQETRMLITHASPGREGLLAQLALVLKADLTVSAGLHFRYGVSYNEFSVQHDHDNYRVKLEASKKAFDEIWGSVKSQVEAVIDDQQRKFLANALTVTSRVPSNAAPAGAAGGATSEEPAWKNSWNWNLPDATFGSLVLNIHEGRVNSEMRSQGFNFAYRTQGGKPGPQQAASTSGPSPAPNASQFQQRPAQSTSKPNNPPPQQQQPKQDGRSGPPPQQQNRPPNHQQRPSQPPQQLSSSNVNKDATPSDLDTNPDAGKSAQQTGSEHDGAPNLSSITGQADAASSNALHQPGQGDHGGRGRGRGRGRGEFRGARGRGGNPGRGGGNVGSGSASPAPPAAPPAQNGA